MLQIGICLLIVIGLTAACRQYSNCNLCNAKGPRCVWCVGGLLNRGECRDSYAIGNDNNSWGQYACNPGFLIGGPIYDKTCTMTHRSPNDDFKRSGDCRDLSGECGECNAAGTIDTSVAGGFKCHFCSAQTSNPLTKPGCYAYDPTIGPACVGITTGARQTARLFHDKTCSRTPSPTRAPTPQPTPVPTPVPTPSDSIHLDLHADAEGDQCNLVPQIDADRSVRVRCNRLYYGVWSFGTVSLTDQVPKDKQCGEEGCEVDYCPIASECFKDSLCLFRTQDVRRGRGSCSGSALSLSPICHPLRAVSHAPCDGLSPDVCFADHFDTGAARKYQVVSQAVLSSLTLSIPRSPLWKGSLAFEAAAASVGGSTPPPALLAFYTNPSWDNYVITANFRIVPPALTMPNAMVGVIFRAQSFKGDHYLFGWQSVAASQTSRAGLYQWSGVTKRYTKLKSAINVPTLQAHWSRVRVQVVGKTVKAFLSGRPETDDFDTLVLEHTFGILYLVGKGTGMYFAGADGYTDDFSVRKLPNPGFCGNGSCETGEGEDCVNCPQDCQAPCGCGDGICSGDSEALKCPRDCAICTVKRLDPASAQFLSRADHVAAYFSFDNAQALGKDNSGNQVELEAASATAGTNCGGPSGNGCLKTVAGSPLVVRDATSTFGKLPVRSCEVTIAFRAKVNSQATGKNQVIHWGSTRQSGLASDVTVSYGSSGADGKLTWQHGLLKTSVDVDWTKAGLRSFALVFKDDKLSIYVDGSLATTKRACANVSVPQAVTFGLLQLGDFDGILDEVTIFADDLSAAQVAAVAFFDRLKPIVNMAPATTKAFTLPTKPTMGTTAVAETAVAQTTTAPVAETTVGPTTTTTTTTVVAETTTATTTANADTTRQFLDGCRALSCEECRNDNKCKFCNRGSDQVCVGERFLCPSGYASVDDQAPCPTEIIQPPEFNACNVYTCLGCQESQDGCKWCGERGAWACIRDSDSCEFGGPAVAPDQAKCDEPICANSCGGHGECVFDTVMSNRGPLVGRPICDCEDGYAIDSEKGCVVTETKVVAVSAAPERALAVALTVLATIAMWC